MKTATIKTLDQILSEIRNPTIEVTMKLVVTMGLTAKEVKLIGTFAGDDFLIESGSTWVDGHAEENGMNPRTFSGLMSSLTQKGYVWTDGEAMGFTEKFENDFNA